MDCSEPLLQNLIADLQRQARWAGIIPFLEANSADVIAHKRQLPATYAKISDG